MWPMPTYHQNLGKTCSKLQVLQNISWNGQNLTFLTSLFDPFTIWWVAGKVPPIPTYHQNFERFPKYPTLVDTITAVDWPVNMTGVINIMRTVNLNDAIGYAYDMTGEIHIMRTGKLEWCFWICIWYIFVVKSCKKMVKL